MPLQTKHLEQADFDLSDRAIDSAQKNPRSAPRLADGEAEAAASPVHRLQGRISHELSETPQDRPWSARRTLLVASLISAAGWLLLGLALR